MTQATPAVDTASKNADEAIRWMLTEGGGDAVATEFLNESEKANGGQPAPPFAFVVFDMQDEVAKAMATAKLGPEQVAIWTTAGIRYPFVVVPIELALGLVKEHSEPPPGVRRICEAAGPGASMVIVITAGQFAARSLKTTPVNAAGGAS